MVRKLWRYSLFQTSVSEKRNKFLRLFVLWADMIRAARYLSAYRKQIIKFWKCITNCFTMVFVLILLIMVCGLMLLLYYFTWLISEVFEKLRWLVLAKYSKQRKLTSHVLMLVGCFSGKVKVIGQSYDRTIEVSALSKMNSSGCFLIELSLSTWSVYGNH